jgi:hypothetical protein
MWQSLCGLYQSPNQNHKMVLQEKLRGTKLTKTDPVTSLLTRFSQIRDALAAVGEIVDPSELVRTTLNGFFEHCPNRKKKKQGGTAARAKEDEFVSKFERECSLIVCCSIVETPSRI